ncbi:MAG: carbohydrate-binding family 9-like protein [Bacteroidota bacterium]
MILPLYFIILMTSGLLHQPTEDTKIYQVKKIQSELDVTGKGNSPLWKNATELSDFTYPWETQQPPFTSFKALHSKDWFYCLFNVKDDNVNVYVVKNDKSEVVYSDRVEIFFRKDDRLSPYYGLELDPNARILDYKAEFPRKFNDTWTWPSGQLIVKANRTADGYSVEIAISKESLKQLEVLKNRKIEAGLFRANCLELNGESEAHIKWISWVKPDSKTPDFHIPSAFGVLILQD